MFDRLRSALRRAGQRITRVFRRPGPPTPEAPPPEPEAPPPVVGRPPEPEPGRDVEEPDTGVIVSTRPPGPGYLPRHDYDSLDAAKSYITDVGAGPEYTRLRAAARPDGRTAYVVYVKAGNPTTRNA